MANEEYIAGFKCGKGIGFQFGRLAMATEMCKTKSMIKLIGVGFSLGYLLGFIVGKIFK